MFAGGLLALLRTDVLQQAKSPILVDRDFRIRVVEIREEKLFSILSPAGEGMPRRGMNSYPSLIVVMEVVSVHMAWDSVRIVTKEVDKVINAVKIVQLPGREQSLIRIVEAKVRQNARCKMKEEIIGNTLFEGLVRSGCNHANICCQPTNTRRL